MDRYSRHPVLRLLGLTRFDPVLKRVGSAVIEFTQRERFHLFKSAVVSGWF